MAHKKEHKAAGGKTEAQTGPHEEETNRKNEGKELHAGEYKDGKRAERVVEEEKKKGGEVKRRKRGGMVGGHKPAMRLDKKARGGSPKNPLSGANAENLPYAHPNLKPGSEGMGKDRT